MCPVEVAVRERLIFFFTYFVKLLIKYRKEIVQMIATRKITMKWTLRFKIFIHFIIIFNSIASVRADKHFEKQITLGSACTVYAKTRTNRP